MESRISSIFYQQREARIFDFFNDFRQNLQARGDAVKLAASVIGNHYGSSTMVERPSRILCGENALDDDRSFPERANPRHVAPTECLALHRRVSVANPKYTPFRADNIRHVGKAAV